MGKRKRQESAELPLFDLPLQSVGGQPEQADGDAGGSPSSPSGESPSPSGELPTGELPSGELPSGESPSGESPSPAAAVEPSQLYTEAHDAGDPQIDLIELSGTGDAETEAEVPATGRGTTAEALDGRALLGDRLLAGLADLAVQWVMLGAALAVAHAQGIAVAFADWMPFAVLALVFSFLYWIVPLAFWGQTPGMAWVGHVARAERGEPLTFGQTFRRWLGALFTLAFAGLPFLLALTGRSFSDRLSDSHTVAEP